jgi:hypothetical protein
LKGRQYLPFPIEISGEVKPVGSTIKLLELQVRGTTHSVYLTEKSEFGHTISITLNEDDIKSLKSAVRKSPHYTAEDEFRWPIQGHSIVKFICKLHPGTKYANVWDATQGVIADINDRRRLDHNRVEAGAQVYIEFIPSTWRFESAAQSSSGCTFKLLSIGLLQNDNDAYDFESSFQKKRVA